MKRTVLVLIVALSAIAGGKPCKPPAVNFSVFVDDFTDQVPHAVLVWQISPPKAKVVIERADSFDGGASFGDWHVVAVQPPNASAWLDYGVNFGTPYLYRIGTANNCGETWTGPLWFQYCGGLACP
jgi:hypothetical protein